MLILASVVFYGYWDFRLIPLLITSILINWLLSRTLKSSQKKLTVIIGIIVNLGIIGVFKYADFFAESFAWFQGETHQSLNIILPLGISFFTFQQISYLIDRYKEKAPLYSFREYFLYVCFFPQLIAGPIVRHNEFIHQLKLSPIREGLYERLSRGSTLLTIGLIKKVFFADTAAKIANPLFQSAEITQLPFIDVWLATAAFTVQIYFDFSGYSDMAIGMALMFGFTLPINFNAPYRAVSIQDFWRRWHITLSHFLRDYLYIPMGGSRSGISRQMIALIITMFLGGLWHGAGWTFVVWGLMHGFALGLCTIWQTTNIQFPKTISWIFTLLFVMIAWILFRAPDFNVAIGMLQSLIEVHQFGVVTGNYGASPLLLVLAAGTALIGPTSQKIALKLNYNTPFIAAPIALALVLIIIEVGSQTHPDFIYFQF
ncbi:MBOAT family O-acyltransferase [Kiloniella spongiae]|uniref:MBOAT family O-acyltransferase n=1 Tax=Kiloniella spongiae TaxID=1489064 RepID=UPI00069A9051|nr:MBOAT family O-acyltransferase [Kiloniella spongiae]